MASNRTQLVVEILTDTAKAAQGLNETANKFESFGKKLVGAVVGAVAIKGVSDLAKTVVSSASEMQQAMGGTDKVFGSSASAIHSWAADTSDSIRLPAVAAEQFATLIKTQLNATGQPIEQLVKSTKDLIQVGADLSAVTGADLADSIAAVKSALAGEYDPIQNLGVAMSGASVNARALALAHGDATLAASDAIVMQARVAEIMEKSAFATGAAAEEATSFQARIDSLKEKATDLAGAVGGPLLDALGGIVGHITDAASGAETLGIGLGTMLGSVLALPAPIQAVTVGLAAFAAISAVWGTKALAGFTAFIGGVKGATTSVTGLKAALSAIGPALAGGALLVGAAVLIGVIATAIGRVSQSAKAGEDALSGYRDAIVAAGGASNEATAAAFQQAVTTSDAFKSLIEGGFSAAEAVKILTGTQEEWIAVQSNGSDASRNMTKDMLTLTDGFIDANGHAKSLAQAQIDGAKAMQGGGDAADANAKALADEAAAAADAEAAQKKLAEAVKAAQEAASRTVVNRGLDQMKRDAEDAQRAVDFFALTLDKLTGGTRALDQAQADFNKSLTGNASAFEESAGFIEANKDALLSWNVSAITASEKGQDIYDSLVQVRTGYETVVGAAYAASVAAGDDAGAQAQAKAQADAAYGAFVNQASAMHLSAEETATLAAQLGILDSTRLDPKVFQLIAEDKQARDTIVALQTQGVDPITIQVLAGPDGALNTIDDVLSYVDTTGATVTVPINATTAPAESKVDDFTGQRIATPDSFISVRANLSQAQAAVTAFMSSKRDVTISVLGNLVDVQAKVTAFMSVQRTVTISILGDTGPVNNAIRSVIGGSYSVTISIKANADQFYAVYNSLPTSKTITQQVVQAPAPAPGVAPTLGRGVTTLAPAGQLSLARAGAFGVGTPVATGSVAGNGTTIIVNGAIDPDSVARQIASLLRTRDRRVGGIEIGSGLTRIVG